MTYGQQRFSQLNEVYSTTFFWVLDARQASIACATFQQTVFIPVMAINGLLLSRSDKCFPRPEIKEDFLIGIYANLVILFSKFIFNFVVIHASLRGRRKLLIPTLLFTPVTYVYLAFKVVALQNMIGGPLNAFLLIVIFVATIGFGGYAWLAMFSLYRQLRSQEESAINFCSMSPHDGKIFRLATPPSCLSFKRPSAEIFTSVVV